jgi:branched-subunit amino acid transport protein
MRLEYALLILGMAVVAYLPRVFPAFFIEKLKFSEKFTKFLGLIPYTAMTALVIPGVITVDPSKLYIGIVGALVAGVLAYKKAPVMVCLISAIVVDIALYLIF